MKKFFSQYTQEGLPNGANQITTNSQGFIVSERGQWDFPGQPTMIPNANGKITMKNVYDRLLGIDDQGNAMIMEPGGEYQFPGNNVFEIPLPKAQMGVIGQQASNKRKGNIYPYLSYGTEGSYPTAGVEYIKDIPSRDRTLQQAVGAGLYGSPEKVGVGARYSSQFRDPQKPFKALMDVYGGYGTDQGFYTGLGAYPMFDIVDRKDASFRAGPYFGYGIQTKLPEGIASAIESEGTYFDDPQNLPFSQKLPLTSSFRYGAGAEGRLKDFYGKAKFWFDPIQGKLSDPTSDNPIIKAYQEKEGTEQVHFKPSFEISAGYNIPVSSDRRKIKEQIAKINLEKEREKIRAQQESMPLNETFFVKSQDLKNRILDPVTTKPTKKQRYKFQDGGQKDSWGRPSNSIWYGFDPGKKQFTTKDAWGRSPGSEWYGFNPELNTWTKGNKVQQAVKKESQKVQDYYRHYMNSPMYKEMLGFNPDIDSKRKENLGYSFNDTPSVSLIPQDKDNPDTGGWSYSESGNIEIMPKGLGVKGLLPHEWSHSIDRPRGSDGQRLIPQKDIDYIKKTTVRDEDILKLPRFQDYSSYTLDELKRDDPEWIQNEIDWKNYVGEPTEVRARLNDIRYQSKQRGLYDPFTQKVTPEIYEILKNTEFEKGENKGFGALQQLKDIYTDEQIMYMLNNISQNAPSDNTDNTNEMFVAKSGGFVKAQRGIEKEQDLPGMYAYADKKKQKRFANLLDQAKAFGKTIEGRIVDKENIYPDFSIKNVGQYVKDVKEYQKQAADYEKARRLVKEGTMSEESFLDRYNKNNWAKFDQATRINTPEEQAELEETWYGPTDEQGRRRWMSDPRNVAKVAGAVAVGAPLAPAAAILAPAAGAALANPLVQAGLTGYGVYDAATNTIPEAYRDFSEGRYLEGLGNVGMAALDVAPIPIFGTNLLDEAGQVGKYLTTKTPNITPIFSKLPFNMDQETRDLLNYPNFNVTTGESIVPFTPSEGLDFDFKTFSPGWNAMQEAQLKLQGIKGPDIPDVSKLPWRKIDDMDLNPQGVSPEKYQEYGLDPEGFAFGKLKGERASMDPNYLENIKFAKQQALDRGDDQMANIYDDLLKRKQKEALESFTEPYTAQKAFKEIKYNMADDSDIDNAIDWANPNKEAHQTITKTITDVRENKLKNWSSDEGKKRLQAMIDETPWLKDNGITPESYIDSIAGMDDTNLQYLNDLQELDNLVSQQIKLNDLSDQNLISESDWAIQTMDLEEKIQNTQKTILKRRSSINEAGPFNAYLEGRKPLDVQATMQSQFKGFDANGKPIFDTSVPFIYNENTPDVSSRIAIGEKTLPSDLKQVIEHEIGHLLQKGAQTNLDKELESLSLKGDDLFTNIKSKDGVGKTGWSEFKESPEYFGKSKRYFETGSTGREKLPFLLEVRQDMLERGVIKDMYQEITPEMLERHYTNYMKGNLKGDKTIPLRIFDIMENKKSNFNLLSKVVNKAPVILPVAGTAGVLSTMGNNTESEEPFSTFRPLYKQGGSIDMELTPEEIKWYKDNGYVVEDINEYQEGGDVISSYGWDYKKEGDKYFTRKTGTEDWITPQGEALQAIKQKIYNEIPYTVQDRKSEYLANLQNLVAQGYGIDDLVKMGMGTKAGLTSILGSTEYVEATPVKETKVAETPVAKNSYWNPARYGNKFAITGMQNPKFALDMSSVNNFKLSKTPENVVHAKELRRTGKQLTPQEQAAFDINYNPNQSIQDKLIYRQDNQPYKEPKVYTASEVIPTTYHWNPIFNTYSDTMGELFNPDTSFEVSDSLTKSSLPLANEIEGYNILKQKIKNELASNKPELKIEKIFRNKEQGEELLERQHLDNIYYGQFMNRGNAVANRTGIGRHRDSNILISDIVEKNPNTVVIDIGSGLGNDNPELAGVSLTELPKNVFAKAKVIGTDIPESYERFKMHQKEKQYPFDSYRVPLNFNTPVKDIIDKKAKNSKTVVLRAANSIDLLMNPEEAQKHLEHILKQTFGKEVYYLFNKHVLYKDSKSNSFKIIGQINNAGFDHINNSWETNLDRKSYELFEKESLR